MGIFEMGWEKPSPIQVHDVCLFVMFEICYKDCLEDSTPPLASCFRSINAMQ